MKRHRLLTSILLLLGVGGMAAVAVLAVSSQSHTPQSVRATVASSRSRAAYVSVERASRVTARGRISQLLVKHYAVLRRARIASASGPGYLQDLGPMGQQWGLEPSQARSITLPDGQPAWVIPGTAGGCLAAGNGIGCQSSGTLATTGLIDVAGGTSETITGLVPDGVSLSAVKADGSTVPVAVTDNAFELSTSSANPFRTIEMRSSSGTVSDISIPPTVGRGEGPHFH